MRVTVAAEDQRSEVTYAAQHILLFHVTSEGAETAHQGRDLVESGEDMFRVRCEA